MSAERESREHDPAPRSSWRTLIHRELDPSARRSGLSLTNQVLAVLIASATMIAVAETEPTLAGFASAFAVAEAVFGLAFGLEYAARLWTAPERRHGEASWRARARFMLSPSGLLDLAAVLGSFSGVGTGAFVLRLLRLARILRLAKLGRMSRAALHISEAVASRRDELLLSAAAGLALMLAAATGLYMAEGEAQPDKFGSIPRALWWAVATTTTVGYGDVFPVTALGKLLASLTAVFSIGLVALPAGILAAAFSDAVQRHKSEQAATGAARLEEA